MRKIKGCIISAILIGTLLFSSGCAKKDNENIELLKPSSELYGCTQVTKGTLSDNKYLIGKAMGQDYTMNFPECVTIDRVHVKPGDKVNEGDILLEYSASDKIDERKELVADKAKLEKEYSYQKEILQTQVDKLKASLSNDKLDSETRKENEKNILINEEEMNYNETKFDNEKAEIEKKIEELDKSIDKAYLKAEHSGYIKNIVSEQSSVYPNISCCVIYDPEDISLYLPVTYFDYTVYKKYKYVFINVDGVNHMLEIQPISSQFEFLASINMTYPYVQLKCPSYNLTEGQNYVVEFANSFDECILTPNDSIKSDKKGTYVYVKNGDDKEKRYIEIGQNNQTNTEVISGLSVGELVYFETDTIPPEEYFETTITREDYLETAELGALFKTEQKAQKIINHYNGECVEINVENGTYVNKGDLLYKVKCSEQYDKNTLNNLKLEIDNLNMELKTLKQDFDESYSLITNKYDKKIAELKYNQAYDNINSELTSIQEKYDKLLLNNDGNGVISVYSPYEGRISFVCIELNSYLYEDDAAFVLEQNVEVTLSTTINGGDSVDQNTLFNIYPMMNSKLIIEDDEATIDTKCLGYAIYTTGDATEDRFNFKNNYWPILLGKNNDSFIIQSVNGMNENLYKLVYIGSEGLDTSKLKDGSTVKYEAMNLKNVIILDASCIKQDNKGNSYVWKKNDTRIDKVYVNYVTFNDKAVIISGLSVDDTVIY